MDTVLTELIQDLELDDLPRPPRPRTNRISLEVKRDMAQFFQACGIKPCWSTNIGDEMNAGYGDLDENGFWEFPL